VVESENGIRGQMGLMACASGWTIQLLALIEPINGSSELHVEKFPCDLNSNSCAAIEAASLAGKPENTCLSICSIFGRLFSFSEVLLDVVNGASQRVGPIASASGWYFSHWRLVLFLRALQENYSLCNF
jgi:hypothetical protein